MNGLSDSGRRRLKHQEVERIRLIRGGSMLLFITDRCPVGCEHCSVDSRGSSPTISDFDLFEEIVEWMCGQPQIKVVGISGGEPFAERRGLSLASQRFALAGKRLVIFTSGVWARTARTPHWIREVLSDCSCVYLSTDAFHARMVEDSHLVRAAQAVAAAGAWLVVQILDHGDAVERVERLLHEAFGEAWPSWAEVNLILPLTSGRGASIFKRTAHVTGQNFGPCSLARSPMIRYDGVVTACCNENVIMGQGPQRLRQRARSRDEIGTAIQVFHDDQLLRVIGDAGLGVLTEHPRLNDLALQRFTTNCELCWKVMARMPNRDEPDRLVSAISALQTDA
jgi:organic radical activating enzyme